PRRKQEELAEYWNVNDDPLQCLKCLLFALIQSEMGEHLLASKRGSLDWIGVDIEKKNPLYKGLLKGWQKWLKAHGDTSDNKVYYSGPDDPSDVRTEFHLPTIYIRMLLNITCWWLFYSSSRAIQENGGDLWGRSTAELILDLLHREL